MKTMNNKKFLCELQQTLTNNDEYTERKQEQKKLLVGLLIICVVLINPFLMPLYDTTLINSVVPDDQKYNE